MSLLIKSLPDKVNASNHKSKANHRENRNRDRMEALHYAFIQFNTPYRVSLMVFDIDFIDGKKAIDVYNLYEMTHEIYAVTGCIPTYVLQTTKGYHFAFHLEQQVYIKNEKAKKYLTDVKNAIIDSLGCDKIASSRSYGIWRNPLVHDFWYSNEIDYDLNSFKHLIKLRKNDYHKPTSSNPLLTNSINQLVEKQRNDTLFRFGINYCLSNQIKEYKDLEIYLLRTNRYARPPLEESEVISIVKSVYKYKEAGKLYRPKIQSRNIQRGIMGFKKIANETYKDYQRIRKYRQFRSAQRTNALPGQKAKQRKAMLKAQKVKIERTQAKIKSLLKKVIASMKEQGEKLSYVNIGKVSELDRRTAKKYIDLFKLL